MRKRNPVPQDPSPDPGSLAAAAVNSLIVLLFDLLPAEVLGIAVAIFGGICGGLGGVVGPLILGRSYDHTGSFFWGFSSLAVGATAGALVLIPVVFHERRVKREKVEKVALVQIFDKREALTLR